MVTWYFIKVFIESLIYKGGIMDFKSKTSVPFDRLQLTKILTTSDFDHVIFVKTFTPAFGQTAYRQEVSSVSKT